MSKARSHVSNLPYSGIGLVPQLLQQLRLWLGQTIQVGQRNHSQTLAFAMPQLVQHRFEHHTTRVGFAVHHDEGKALDRGVVGELLEEIGYVVACKIDTDVGAQRPSCGHLTPPCIAERVAAPNAGLAKSVSLPAVARARRSAKGTDRRTRDGLGACDAHSLRCVAVRGRARALYTALLRCRQGRARPTAPLTNSAARDLTDRIKGYVEAAWDLIKQAYALRVWTALGYGSWDEYCAAEFDRAHIRLPREERQEVVASLRDIGMSTRAIAAATGMDQSTVSRQLAGDANASPATVTGTDGKSYPPKPPAPDSFSPSREPGSGWAPPRTRRAALPEAVWRAVVELRKSVERLDRLADDNRFDKHVVQLATQHLADLTRARDTLQAVIDRLTYQ